MAKALFELNPNLDRAALAQRFAADTRLQVENILTEEQRKALTSRSSRYRSSKRTGRTSSKTSSAKPLKASTDKTPK